MAEGWEWRKSLSWSSVRTSESMLTGCPDEARSLITHRYGLDAVNEAFDAALNKSSLSIKVHLTPNA